MRNRIFVAVLAALVAFTAVLASTPVTGDCPTINANNTTLARILIDRAEGGCVDNRVRFLGQGQWEISKYQEVSMPSDVLVSGAGSGAANGTYTYRGTYNSHNYYNLLGEADSTTVLCITWGGAQWHIKDGIGNDYYASGVDGADPWGLAYEVDVGVAPVPTVTEIPAAGSFPPNIIAKQAVNRASTY